MSSIFLLFFNIFFCIYLKIIKGLVWPAPVSCATGHPVRSFFRLTIGGGKDKKENMQETPQENYDDYDINRPPGYSAPKGLNKEKIAALRKKGLSMAEVGKIVGCSKNTVFYHLRNMNIEDEAIEDYKKKRADILAGVQLRLLQSITSKDIQKSPLGSRILAVAQLYDKERLERNLATSNQQVIILQVPDSKAQYERMRAEREKALAVREDEPADDEKALFSPPADNPSK